MKNDREMFNHLYRGANPVHPDRLDDLRSIPVRHARPRFLPVVSTLAITVLVTLTAVAVLIRADRAGVPTQIGSGQRATATAEVVGIPPTDAPDTAPSTAVRSQGRQGVGPHSPWAIPATLFEDFELESADMTPDERSPTTKLLREHGGKPLLSNEWVLKGIQGSSPDRMVSPDGPYFVADGRYRFDSAEGARAFLTECMEAVRQELRQAVPGAYRDFSRSDEAPALGDEAILYTGTLPDGFAPIAGESKTYGYAFRNGNVVSRVIVTGDQGMTEKQAMEMAEAAEAQVREALDEGK